jgi:sugar O-acyltransferase (sialic acid O-acetyltransferase NeuD family)
MALQPIVVFGAGGQAKVVAASLARGGQWCVAGFVDSVNPQRIGTSFAGSRVIDAAAGLQSCRDAGVCDMVIAVGDNAARLSLARRLGDQGWRFPALIDVHAVVADDAVIGAGCFIGAAAVVQPGCTIGAQTIVNTGAIVEHDCSVGEGVHIGPRACLCGHVQVGAQAWIGAGAVIRDRRAVGARCMVGMGAVVVADAAADWVVYGQPARPVRPVGEQ